MAKVGQMIESNYLKQADIEGDVVVTVVKVGQKNIAKEGDQPEMKWLVRFEEFKKPMVLNATNIKRLSRACKSEETDDWTGKQAILYVDHDVEFAGNVVGGLRIKPMQIEPATRSVRPAPTGGKFDDMDDDIPF
jgi:hypothetical protein